jgi:hypothetical protein
MTETLALRYALALVLAASSFTVVGFAQGTRGGRGADQGGGGSAPPNAYAYADCSGSNTTTRIVIITGALPASVPAASPRPSLEIVLNNPAEQIPPSAVTVSPEGVKGGPSAAVLSCPVVGNCAPANTGSVTAQRGADGTITGNYQATWSQGQPRQGRFTASWRDSQKKCG